MYQSAEREKAGEIVSGFILVCGKEEGKMFFPLNPRTSKMQPDGEDMFICGTEQLSPSPSPNLSVTEMERVILMFE